MEFDDFPDHIGNGISSSTTDEHIFQRGRYTTNQKMIKQNKNNNIINYIYKRLGDNDKNKLYKKTNDDKYDR